MRLCNHITHLSLCLGVIGYFKCPCNAGHVTIVLSMSLNFMGNLVLVPLVFKQCRFINIFLYLTLSMMSHLCIVMYLYMPTCGTLVDLLILISISGTFKIILFFLLVLQQVRAAKKDDNGACWGSGSCDQCCDGHPASLLHSQD